jgi:hypothetical protein
VPRAPARQVGFALTLAIGSFCVASRAEPPAPIVAPVDYNAPDPDRDWLNYARAFANITFASYVIFQVNWFRGVNWIYDTRASIGQVLRSDFQFDYDPLDENLLLHPLAGSLYFTAARASGLPFWQSAIFTGVGALEWDWFGERQLVYPGGWRSKPSTNDLVTTATAGILLGEVSYRLASELLDSSTRGSERFFREVAAGLVSPMRGLNRVYTSEAWRPGPPPIRAHPVEIGLDLGLDRLRTNQASYTPTALAAVELWYGDLLPTKSNNTLDPFEYFTGYGAANLANSQLNGAQVYGQGLLYGWSAPLSPDRDERYANNVFGFIQNFDYQGANIVRYGALSVGPADYVEWRFGHRRKVRIGLDVDWTYLAAMSSPFASTFTTYNFSMGGAAGLDGRLEMGPYGNVTLRSRNYVTSVLDGQGQEEVVGYGRIAYDINVLDHIGLGASPTFIYRGSTSSGQHVGATSLEAQVYLHLDN